MRSGAKLPQARSEATILLLTPRHREQEQVRGLELGADGCTLKPCSLHMDQGADWIYIALSGPGFGVIQAAQETGKAKAISSFGDMNEFAPEVVVRNYERVSHQ